MHYHCVPKAAKKETWSFWTVHNKVKNNVTLPVVGKNGSNAIYIACSESCEPKRFFRCWNKIEESIFKKNYEINSTVTTRTWVLSKEWTRKCPSTGMISKCCSSGVLVLYRINKDDGDKSVPVIAFQRDAVNPIFLKYWKKGRSFSSLIGIRNFPSDVCYDDTRCMLYKRNSLCRYIKCKSTW